MKTYNTSKRNDNNVVGNILGIVAPIAKTAVDVITNIVADNNHKNIDIKKGMCDNMLTKESEDLIKACEETGKKLNIYDTTLITLHEVMSGNTMTDAERKRIQNVTKF